jgi:hypothetical protein
LLHATRRCACGACRIDDAPEEPGFPITISASDSYRLTSNLALASANDTAIQISASSVEIDLGGFTIRGITVCSGIPISSCAPTETGVGILGGSDVRVRHGAVAQMGNDGIRLGYASRVEDVHAFSNGGSGIELTTQGYARGNATGGNVCDDGKCTRTGAKRYYLSQNSGNGALALLVCASGFHMASLWEVREPAALEYDRTLGLVRPDSGAGPPADYRGWIRTGYTSFPALQAGLSNCNAWTTSGGGFGSVLSFETDYSLISKVDPVSAYTDSCSLDNHVWCIED